MDSWSVTSFVPLNPDGIVLLHVRLVPGIDGEIVTKCFKRIHKKRWSKNKLTSASLVRSNVCNLAISFWAASNCLSTSAASRLILKDGNGYVGIFLKLNKRLILKRNVLQNKCAATTIQMRPLLKLTLHSLGFHVMILVLVALHTLVVDVLVQQVFVLVLLFVSWHVHAGLVPGIDG